MSAADTTPTSKESIIRHMTLRHEEFNSYLSSLSTEEFEYAPDSIRWNTAQHMEHIRMSLSAFAAVGKYPKWLIKWKFGKANRPSRSYDELNQRYSDRLAQLPSGQEMAFVPHKAMFGERAGIAAAISALVKKLNKKVGTLSESDLDELILPHPLMGKVTFREMMFNVIYHVQRHQHSIEKALAER